MKRLLAVFAVSLLAACGSPEVVPDASYESVDDLRDAYLASGVSDEECGEINDGAREEHGWESVNCGMHTVLVVYLTDPAMDQARSRSWNGPELLEPESSIITGPNWTIQTQTWNAETVQDALGGTIEQGTLAN